ncbi:hypothetical protein [Sphingobacterium detergens]|uniref:Uncharacterized protein n=1 Tax=Sphingobacterium detergens TaxID=1145106 RepID=A0A420B7L4_SPHD1|nr:hypothetical protein [Sphingobacterium detergens]RKE52605.1 hypothetical protein DFQ12_2846 [Sphingobacterium detergens]
MLPLGEGNAAGEPMLKAVVVAAIFNAGKSIDASLNSALIKRATKGGNQMKLANSSGNLL